MYDIMVLDGIAVLDDGTNINSYSYKYPAYLKETFNLVDRRDLIQRIAKFDDTITCLNEIMKYSNNDRGIIFTQDSVQNRKFQLFPSRLDSLSGKIKVLNIHSLYVTIVTL